jgi:GH24 family phage-related lysozyme (muramidase)
MQNKICPCGGGCPRCEIQPKLKVGQPGDPFEQEADRVAEQIMRIPSDTIQRKCSRYQMEDEENVKIHKKTDNAAVSLQRVKPSFIGCENKDQSYTLSKTGSDFIKTREGFCPCIYNDNDKPSNCTMGYGILIHRGPCGSRDEEEYGGNIPSDLPYNGNDGIFEKERFVNKYLKIRLTQNQFDALVSVAYNGWPTGLSEALNSCNFDEAKRIWLSWRNDNKGVVNRHTFEWKFFKNNDPDINKLVTNPTKGRSKKDLKNMGCEGKCYHS